MTLHSRKSLTIVLFWAVVAILGAGCSATQNQQKAEAIPAPVAQPEPAVQEQPCEPAVTKEAPLPEYVHTVKWSGETLSYISKWYTGRYSNWKLLAKANPDIRPDLIRKGNKIIIPERLLVRRTPMPKNFKAKLAPKKKATASKKNGTVEKTESEQKETPLPLFGPK